MKVLKWNIGSQKAYVKTLEEYEWKSRRGRTSIPEEDCVKIPLEVWYLTTHVKKCNWKGSRICTI